MTSDPSQPGKMPPGTLVAEWIKHFTQEAKDRAYSQAFEFLYDLVQDDPEAAWPIIVQLVAQSPSDRLLACVAAGPLEDLLCYHGPAVIDRVLAKSETDSRFRKCLRAVWGQLRMDEKVRARIDEAVKDEPPW